MSNLDFNYFPITTMVIVMRFDGIVNLLNTFPIIKITRMKVKKEFTRKSKIDIPYPGYGGCIISGNYLGMTRGLIISVSKKYFRNSIMLYVSTNKKTVNIKLSSKSALICGSKSEEMAIEGMKYVMDNLKYGQSRLNFIKNNKEIANRTLEWVKEHTKGDIYYIIDDTNIIIKKEDITFFSDKELPSKHSEIIGYIIYEDEQYHELLQTKNQKKTYFDSCNEEILNNKQENGITIFIKKINNIIIPEEYTNGYPDSINSELADFLIRKSPDFIEHKLYCINLDWIFTIDKIYDGSLSIEKIQLSMVNYNYDLGFNINRWKLYKKINGLNGFFARYENLHDTNVTVNLPYSIPENLKERIISKKIRKKHTFLVYKSGFVTQSGPCPELDQEAYIKFNNTMKLIKDDIKQPVKQRKLKYIKFKHNIL